MYALSAMKRQVIVRTILETENVFLHFNTAKISINHE
jgi:hypothetical protein